MADGEMGRRDFLRKAGFLFFGIPIPAIFSGSKCRISEAMNEVCIHLEEHDGDIIELKVGEKVYARYKMRLERVQMP